MNGFCGKNSFVPDFEENLRLALLTMSELIILTKAITY